MLGMVVAKALLLSLGARVMFVKVIFLFSCAMRFTVKQEGIELHLESHSSWKYQLGGAVSLHCCLGRKKSFLNHFSYETTHAYPGCTPAQFQLNKLLPVPMNICKNYVATIKLFQKLEKTRHTSRGAPKKPHRE